MYDEQHAPTGFVRASACGTTNCVEVAVLPNGMIGVRDSKNPARDAPVLTFDRAEWDAFLLGAVAGEFSYGALTAGALANAG